MENGIFKIVIDEKTGGLSSLILKNDPAQMNWIKGLSAWGIPKRNCIWWGNLKNMEFSGMEISGNSVISRYFYEGLSLTVVRTMTEDALHESYIFKNTDSVDMFIQRGELGIYTTFEDRYDSAKQSQNYNSNVHLWCGSENSWIHALKQGFFGTELGLFLTKGSLDCYSVERLAHETSNDRGDFIVHPSPFHLRAGEEYEIAWEIHPFAEGEFEKTLLKFPNLNKITAVNETVFIGESFEWKIENGNAITSAQAFCNGAPIQTEISGNTAKAVFTPGHEGEYTFEFIINGHRAYAKGFCSVPFEELLRNRVEFIISKQQNLDEKSPLYGAYLIYDFEEKTQYYSSFGASRNAMEERLAMGMLVCQYLQTHSNPEMEKSLALFEKFILREVYDTESGMVYRNTGKNPESKRLYNIPWIVTFWMEMYKYKPEKRYIDYSKRSLRSYYREGGAKFYPNACDFPNYLRFLRESGYADAELEALVNEHIENFRRNSTDYPEHEVRFEQTIVSPAATMFASANLIDDAKLHIGLLERFQGHQPDYRLSEIPIRHWDGFWFGKRRLLGDTFPHYWSCLTGHSFALYAKASGNDEYMRKAEKNLRNCLCLFRQDGSASCAYIYPYSIALTNPDGTIKENARRGECYDPWANDQDWALYFYCVVMNKP